MIEVLVAIGKIETRTSGLSRPHPTRSNSEKFLVRCEPTAPKIQSTLAPRSHADAFVAEIPDMPAPGLQLDKLQAGAVADLDLNDPGVHGGRAFIRRSRLVNIGHRSAFVHPDKDMRKMRQTHTRAPQQAVQSGCSTVTPLGTYSTTPFCEKAPASAANLPSSGRTSSPAMRATRSGMFHFSSSQIGKNHILADQLRIQRCNAHHPAAGSPAA